MRLIDGAGDGLPGLVIDAYGPVLRVELSAQGYVPHAEALAAAALEAWPSAQGAVVMARAERGKTAIAALRGQVPEGHVVEEAGRRFFVRTRDPDAPGTGVFVDVRGGRALVAAHARGGKVLNTFAHAGAFSVAAAVGGAAQVTHVDAARKCARWGALNFALNGIDPRGHRFIVDDARKLLARAARRGGYRVIVLDPPVFARAKSKRSTHGGTLVAKDALGPLLSDALTALEPGGGVLLACNDRRLTEAGLRALADEVGADLGIAVDARPMPRADDLTAQRDAHRSTRAVWVVRK